jgi:hypothetical protein
MTDYKMDDLINDYVTRVIDGMGKESLVMYAFVKMRDDLSKYTDAELRSEIREYYPDLLEEYNYA